MLLSQKIIRTCYSRQAFSLCLLPLLCLILTACGGGSSGTGTKQIDGTVFTENSQPISGVTVIVLESGDSTVTDGRGNFSLNTESPTENFTVALDFGAPNTRKVVAQLPANTDNVGLSISIDSASASLIETTQVELSARIVADCKEFFTVGPVIEQIEELPIGITCRVRSHLKMAGMDAVSQQVVLQTRACAKGSAWSTVKSAITNNTGITNIDFIYKNDAQHCQYRVAAPFDLTDTRPAVVTIKPLKQKVTN